MSLDVLGFLLDVLVLVFLGAMIFYSLRLSRSLSDFRAHRQEFDTIIIKLMSSIDQAERSIQNLKQVSARETEELGRMIKQSKALSEELQIINEAGENMAKRLEEVAEKNRKVAQNADLSDPPSERYKPYKPPKAPPQSLQGKDYPSFMKEPPLEEPEPTQKLQSQAERDLYNALRSNKGIIPTNKGRG